MHCQNLLKGLISEKHEFRLAVTLAKVFSRRSNSPQSIRDLQIDGCFSPAETHAIEALLELFVRNGFLKEAFSGCWRLVCTQEDMCKLEQFLQGCKAVDDHYRSSKQAEIVLTLPPNPCQLQEFLAKAGLVMARVHDTKNVFANIAKKATSRFVIMTPFLDREGGSWAISLFEELQESVERVLIVRDKEKVEEILGFLGCDCKDCGVEVLQYSIHDVNNEGKPIKETFHAKVILADECAAYIGSANLTWSSKSHSMEMGCYVHGLAARPVAVVVNSIIKCCSN